MSGMLRFCILLALLAIVFGVDRSKFRTCQDTGFCRRYRDGPVAERDGQFVVDKASVTINENHFTARLASSSANKQPLKLEVGFLQSGSVRVRITQQDVQRWQPNDLLLEAASKYASPRLATSAEIPSEWVTKDPSTFSALSFAAHNSNANDIDVLVIQHSPLKMALYHNDINTIVINERNFLHYEHDSDNANSASELAKAAELEKKRSERHQGKEVVDYGEDGLAIYADGSREEKGDLESADTDHHNSDHNNSQKSAGESFQGHFDSMPRGARSVGIDFSFPCASDVYGLPEHSTPLSLPTTGPIHGRYKDPYRLYTLDVFEYELQEPMALYGTIPVLWAHGTQCAPAAKTNNGNNNNNNNNQQNTAAVFWFNPSESFIDIQQQTPQNNIGKQAHWLSESGEIDFFLLPGPVPKRVSQQFASLVGTQQLPPIFSLGYHQCRWNYRDERDVAQVNSKFEELDFPYDVIWLDIEHTDGKRYFTWDKKVFPNAREMIDNIAAVGRKMVTIVDPHIKRDEHYAVHAEATAKGLYIKTKDGKSDFDGWCWPGSSSYLDFTNPQVRTWWAQQFRLEKYPESTLNLFTWNDMNEPSVFNGPEVSMPKDALNLAGVEHREWHNLYGIYMQMATQQGLIDRAVPLAAANNNNLLSGLLGSSNANTQQQNQNQNQQHNGHYLQVVPESQKPRPFVLTRSFWAGSQRYGAMWTGDNMARWDHLEIAAPMLLSISLAGLSFAGADVGGFMGDPSAELFTRWFQAGAFTPFFRGHAHHDTKRREPWIYGEPHTSLHRAAALLRYSLLPLWYTSFFEAYVSGLPVMRAMFYEYPHDAQSSSIDDQWLVGDSLLVKPVTQEGQTSTSVYLPPNNHGNNNNYDNNNKDNSDGKSLWYDFHTMAPVVTTATQSYRHTLHGLTLASIPVYVRSGKVLVRKLRLRRSATLMKHDPYTLYIAPSQLLADVHTSNTNSNTNTNSGSDNTKEEVVVLATGDLYLDDETTFAYLEGQYAVRQFSYSSSVAGGGAGRRTCVLQNRVHQTYAREIRTLDRATAITQNTQQTAAESESGVAAGVVVERVVVGGQTHAPARVTYTVVNTANSATSSNNSSGEEVAVDFVYETETQTVTLKVRPVQALVMQDWDIVLHY